VGSNPTPSASQSRFLSPGALSSEVLLLLPVARKSHPRRYPFLLYARRKAGIWAKFLRCTDEQCRFKATRPASISGIPTLLPIAGVTETQRERCRDSVTWIGFTTTYNNGGLPKSPQYKTNELWVGKNSQSPSPRDTSQSLSCSISEKRFIPSSSAGPVVSPSHPKAVTIRTFVISLVPQGMFVGGRRMIVPLLCTPAAQRGWSIKETANKLMKVSARAQERTRLHDDGYALITARNAAAAQQFEGGGMAGVAAADNHLAGVFWRNARPLPRTVLRSRLCQIGSRVYYHSVPLSLRAGLLRLTIELISRSES
jgi:hypothetical protein